jgi:hypothetical protein
LSSAVARLRHAIYCLVAAGVVVVVEHTAISGTIPLMARLAVAPRSSRYNQITTVSAGLLGFSVAAVAILVSFDAHRRIVKDLQRGESFKLLVANMLATILLLFVVVLVGLIGPEVDGAARAARSYESVYEWLVIASAFELALTGFYFGVATYAVASHPG